MPEVAYVLKGWPRISELFIASEIYRLEQAGLPLRLYVIKPSDESATHPVVGRIQAPTEYLPPATSLSETTLLAWLRENLPSFMPAVRRTARRHPGGLARACALALASPRGWRRAVRRSAGRNGPRFSRSHAIRVVADRLVVGGRYSGVARMRSTTGWVCASSGGLMTYSRSGVPACSRR